MIKKMKNIEMVQAVKGLNDFVGKDTVVPIALSVAISANIKTLRRELEPYEEVRHKLLDDKPEDIESRFNELCSIETEVNLRTVSPDVLAGIELSTKDYMSLEFMLEENLEFMLEENKSEPESQSE